MIRRSSMNWYREKKKQKTEWPWDGNWLLVADWWLRCGGSGAWGRGLGAREKYANSTKSPTQKKEKEEGDTEKKTTNNWKNTWGSREQKALVGFCGCCCGCCGCCGCCCVKTWERERERERERKEKRNQTTSIGWRPDFLWFSFVLLVHVKSSRKPCVSLCQRVCVCVCVFRNIAYFANPETKHGTCTEFLVYFSVCECVCDCVCVFPIAKTR